MSISSDQQYGAIGLKSDTKYDLKTKFNSSNSTYSQLDVEFELGPNVIIFNEQTRYWQRQVNLEQRTQSRWIFMGTFLYNSSKELIGGTVTSWAVEVDWDLYSSGPIDFFYGENLSQSPVKINNAYDIAPGYTKLFTIPSNFQESGWKNNPSTAVRSDFSEYLPSDWKRNQFGRNLISMSGNNESPQTLTTTSSVDTLTGINKKKDIFKFDADPSGQVDKVTGFNAKEKDILSISKSAFKIDRGTFAIAKNAKTLAKQLATSVDIVYSRQTGELILNANGAEPGYGDDDGVFAVLMGRPTVGNGSVQFY